MRCLQLSQPVKDRYYEQKLGQKHGKDIGTPCKDNYSVYWLKYRITSKRWKYILDDI